MPKTSDPVLRESADARRYPLRRSWNTPLLALLTAVLATSASMAEIPAEGLVAYYPLDGDVADASGNGYHGTNSGAQPATDRFGLSSGALHFDGLSTEATIPVPKDANDYTVSLFLKADSLFYLNHFLLDDGKPGEGNSVDPWIWVFIQGDGTEAGRVGWNWEDINAGNHPFLFSATPMGIPEWHHVAVVREGVQKTIYIDGIADGTQTDSSTPNFNNPNPITIGNAPEHPGSDRHFAGSVDDLYFFSRALTPAEIMSIYEQGGWPNVPVPEIDVNPMMLAFSVMVGGTESGSLAVTNSGTAALVVNSIASDASWLSVVPSSMTVYPGASVEVTVSADATGRSPGEYECHVVLLSNDFDAEETEVPVTLQVIGMSGLVAYYPFGGSTSDMSGNCHHGTIHGGVVPTSDRFGNENSAYHFDGTYGASFIRVEPSNHLDHQSHTISAWAKWEGNDTYGHPFGGIFNNGYMIDHYALVAGGEFVRSFINYPNSPDDEHMYHTPMLSDHEFHHLATSYDGSVRRLWVDGELVSEVPFTEPIDYATREACYIGLNFPGGHDAFKGVIDDIRVYDYAIDSALVESLYHEGGWHSAATIAGAVLGPEGRLTGVPVDIVDGVGTLIGEAVTGSDGAYQFTDLSIGDYTVSIITPLGYVADAESKAVIIQGEDVVCDFDLTPMDLAYDPRGVGFWKHQLKVYLTGRGKAQIDEADFTTYLSDISAHFTNSPANPVAVYVVKQPADHVDSLQAAYDLVNMGGNAPMAQKAKRHMMALLLNVTSLQLPQFARVSYDGATASQAITYCWQLITDDQTANDELAKDIAEGINEGGTIAAGVIPTDTPEISYGHPDTPMPVACVLLPNMPNPFATETTLSFGIPAIAHTKVIVTDALGRQIAIVVDETLAAGYYTASWDATSVPSGVYFCQLISGSDRRVRPMMVLH